MNNNQKCLDLNNFFNVMCLWEREAEKIELMMKLIWLALQSISPTTTINCKSELLVGQLKEYTIEFKCGGDLR